MDTTESFADGLNAGETNDGSAIVSATVIEGKAAGSLVTYEAQLNGTISEGQAAGEAWSASAQLTLSFQEGQHAGDATWSAAEVQVVLSESTLAGDLFAGSNLVLAQIIEDALAGQLVSGTVTYDVRVLVTLFDEATEAVINGVDQQDRLPEVAADGSFTLKLNGEDNVIVALAGVGSGQIEKHVLGLFWLWNDGIQDRTGIQLVRFRVQKLGCSFSRPCPKMKPPTNSPRAIRIDGNSGR